MMRTAPGHWSELRTWHTNLALGLMGFGLVAWTRQLIVEYDTVHNYHFGFDGISGASFALYLGAILVFLIKPANTDRFTFPIILTVAIACRVVTLFPEPALSSDVYRYAWDGVVQHAHINPYRYVPGDAALTALRAPNQDLFDNMNRRDYAHTIYPPIAQMVFFVITWFSPVVTGMKLGMILFEGLTMAGLVKLLAHLGRPREWTLLYAWCPLLIWEIGGSGHVDAVVMAFVTFALLFRFRRQPVLTGLLFALAVFTKFFPAVLFPAFYQRRPDGRLDWKMPLTFAVTGVLCYLPYLSVGKGVFGFLGGYAEEEGMKTGARFFLLDWAQHLPGLQGLPEQAFLVFAALVFGGISLWAWRTCCRADSPAASFLPPAFALALALMLLFSPHYPWYISWLLPFFVLMPSMTVATYIGGLFFLCTTALAVGFGPQQYELNKILYSAIAASLLAEAVLRSLPATAPWFRQTIPIHPGVDRT